MIQKKICMVGSFSVGKTSLVGRFVHSIFSDKYLSTVGVKIDKKEVQVDGQDVKLILWDLEGHANTGAVKTSYLKGAAGYLLVVDGTRRQTLEHALELHKLARGVIGQAPALGLLNKHDLVDEWDISSEDQALLEQAGCKVLFTSAKTGESVEEAFQLLARMILEA